MATEKEYGCTAAALATGFMLTIYGLPVVILLLVAHAYGLI